jgi:endogenous inhibitor of DNA gyrase (YacG/DUF329 family)
MPRQFTCPTCERVIEWSEEFPFRPFCSERCRLIDLGAWLAEEHRIAGEPGEDSARDAGGEAADEPEEVGPNPQRRN